MLEVADPIYRAPMATLAMTGIRAGELLGLQWRDLDFLSRRITIERSVWRGQLQTTKTEASERVIGMPRPLAQVLLNHRRVSSFTAPDDFVFCQADGRPIDPDSLREYGIYAAMKKAGIPYVKRASGCHAFRHLAGSIIHKETGSLKLAQSSSAIRTCRRPEIFTLVSKTRRWTDPLLSSEVHLAILGQNLWQKRSKEAKMCSDPKGNQAGKTAQGSRRTLDSTAVLGTGCFYQCLVAGRGFEPPTFGL